MINEIKKNDFKFQVNYLDNNSQDSMDDDFQTSGKYLTFNPYTNRLGTENKIVNLAKKNTKMSSNIDEDNESDNMNNNNNENKSSNFLDIHIPFQDNNKIQNKNNKNEEKVGSHITRLTVSSHNIVSFIEKNGNDIKKNISENKNSKKENLLNLYAPESSINSLDKKNKKKLNPISPNKKKRKKKILVLEEKKKYKSKNRSVSVMEEKEEDKKILRKDKNGIPICKKNRKKVKISFEKPFEIITPIESYKKYNIIDDLPKDDHFMNSGECQCCLLF